MRITASATTGITGLQLVGGFDPACIRPDGVERKLFAEAEPVYYVRTTLQAVLIGGSVKTDSGKNINLGRFSLLANVLIEKEGYPSSEEVLVGAGGSVRMIRTSKGVYKERGGQWIFEKKGD